MKLVNLRAVRQSGVTYVSFDDMIAWLASIGMMPGIEDGQRRLINAIVKDLRSSDFATSELAGPHVPLTRPIDESQVF